MNSRPPQCDCGALPTELRPRRPTPKSRMRWAETSGGHLGRGRLPLSRIAAAAPVPRIKPQLGLFAHRRPATCVRISLPSIPPGPSPMRALLDVILIVLATLHLAADRGGGAVVADRLQRRQRPQPVRRHDRRFSLPDHRTGAAADPRHDAEPRRPRHLAGHPHPASSISFRMSSRSTSTPTCSEPAACRRGSAVPRRDHADRAADAERRQRRDRRHRARWPTAARC